MNGVERIGKRVSVMERDDLHPNAVLRERLTQGGHTVRRAAAFRVKTGDGEENFQSKAETLKI